MAKSKEAGSAAPDRLEDLARECYLVLLAAGTGRQHDHLALQAYGAAEAFLKAAEAKRQAADKL